MSVGCQMQFRNRRVSVLSLLRAVARRAYSHAVDAETREYLDAIRTELGAVRRDMATKDDLRTEIAAVRRDMATKEELGAIRQEMAADLRTETAALRRDMATAEGVQAAMATLRRHFDVTVEGMREDMKILAEGIVMNAEALGRFRTEVIAEIHELRRGR